MLRRLITHLGFVAGAAIVSMWLIAASFAQSAPETPAMDAAATAAEKPALVFPETGPFNPEKIAIPQAKMIAAWSKSAHADLSAEAFAHWNDEGEIPAQCAVCHSGSGFRALHGLDGSAPGMPDHPFPVGGVVDCETCHNPGLSKVKEITFPSGVKHPVVGVEAACMSCHQGRESGVSVMNATLDMEDDTVNPKLRFINPHYRLAAATNLGGYGQVGYQYPGKTYSGRFMHAKPIGTCVSCHNPHSLEVETETCATCHFTTDPDEIRLSHVSFDGSGDTEKGIKSDIAANADALQKAYFAYAADVVGTPMVFDGHRYPYFFTDANGDGVADQDEDGKVMSYSNWTPRLLKAVYNWKVVTADPGIHAHNPYYALELLYDSIEDLASADGLDVDMGGMLR